MGISALSLRFQKIAQYKGEQISSFPYNLFVISFSHIAPFVPVVVDFSPLNIPDFVDNGALFDQQLNFTGNSSIGGLIFRFQ